MATVWMTVTALKFRKLHFLCMPYIHFKITHDVCGILIEKDCFKLLFIWLISQYLAAHFSHFKAMINNMVHNGGPYLIWYAPLSLASSASSSVLPLFPFIMHPYSSSSSWLLTLIVSWMYIECKNVLLLCCPLSIYAFELKVREMHLWAILENWFIIGWSIFLSLVKIKSIFSCKIHGKFTKSVIEMCRKNAWQFMTTRSTILHLMTYKMNKWLDVLRGKTIAQRTI